MWDTRAMFVFRLFVSFPASPLHFCIFVLLLLLLLDFFAFWQQRDFIIVQHDDPRRPRYATKQLHEYLCARGVCFHLKRAFMEHIDTLSYIFSRKDIDDFRQVSGISVFSYFLFKNLHNLGKICIGIGYLIVLSFVMSKCESTGYLLVHKTQTVCVVSGQTFLFLALCSVAVIKQRQRIARQIAFSRKMRLRV